MSTDGPLAEAEEVKPEPCRQGEGSRIQQAKKTDSQPQFLQIVAKPSRVVRKVEAKPEPKLTRVAFAVSRLMEFCSKRELQNQTGHSVYDWPLVVTKELFDNALDACEEAEVAPDITVIVEQDKIIVQDNANGIDAKTIESILDYTIRVSSREAYVSPTRGAQGNALKTILAMGYVLQGAASDAAGVTIIETSGVAHRIEFRSDHIDNQPKIIHTTAPSPIGAGTRFAVHWPAPELLGPDRFWQLVRAYVWFNPHLTVRGVWFGHEFINVTATNPNWEKWRPRNPTSAHWYDEQRLQRYLAAHVARDRDLGQSRTAREFIAEFRGLSGTARQRRILDEVGCSHQSLASLLRHRSGQPRRHRQAAGRHEAAQQAGRSAASRHHRRRALQGAVRRRRRRSRYLQIPDPQRTSTTRHPLHHRVCFRAAPDRTPRRRPRPPRIRHRCQLVRRDQQPVPPVRKHGRGARKCTPQGAHHRQAAGYLRGAPCLGLHPVRRPRQKLDHPRRRSGAAR